MVNYRNASECKFISVRNESVYEYLKVSQDEKTNILKSVYEPTRRIFTGSHFHTQHRIAE